MAAKAIVAAVMAEPVALPGCPDIIVTRGWLYAWLRDSLGYDQKGRGFASLDYLVFGRRQSAEPLTDLSQPRIARLLAFMVETQ